MSIPQVDQHGVDSKYRLEDAVIRPEGRVFASGTQALVRMMLMQRLVDRRDGIRSAGFISGYRGSPLAGVDTELWRSKQALDRHDIKFLPAVNEDLAATAISGTQRVGSDLNRTVDGVFALWYGKGPGVDRAGDAIRHGHAAGASKKGGVLLVVGDDHEATSSTIPNASDLSLKGWNAPIIHPAGVDDYVSFGLWGWAASRFSGAWVAFKAISETVESSRSFTAAALPTFSIPATEISSREDLGYNTRDFLTTALELRMARRLEAISAFARANPLDRLLTGPSPADIGIVAVGKAGLDLMEALLRAGLPPKRLAEVGVRVWQPGLVFPLDREAFEAFSVGLKHILVVEEKTGLVEEQAKEILFNRAADIRPSVVGRRFLDGSPLISPIGQLRPSSLIGPLTRWLAAIRPDIALPDVATLFEKPPTPSNVADGMRRLPYFCSGCPHNSSTKVPEGSIALAGIGCHYMANWMDRQTSGITPMGAEGADWVGQAGFTLTPHVFQNMGDGTYFHSGYLAIRQSIAAGHNVTYKILFNDAVAMTGGQPVDGQLGVPQIVRQMQSEGARKVVVVTDDVSRYERVALGSDVSVHDRHELDTVQRELRAIKGVGVMVYDQTCAAEKRRRRKKGSYPDPSKRAFINRAVCEGCGDCGRASNCLSIVPLETEFGTKRAIDQTSCNKDFSCIDGFCPSFVSVIGGKLRKAKPIGTDWIARAERLAAPPLAMPEDRPHNLLIVGVGGSGVITAGAVVAMAAHLDHLEVAELDFTALAQKGGSVMCHLRFANSGTQINQTRIDWGEADAVIMGDLIVGCLPDSIGTIRHGATRVLANTHIGSTAEFTRDPDFDSRGEELLRKVGHAASKEMLSSLDAHQRVQEEFGDAVCVNMFLIGHAWQQGLIPVSQTAIRQAIVLNGVAVEANLGAFAFGRTFAAGAAGAASAVAATAQPQDWRALLERRASQLIDYQNEAYAAPYRGFVERCAAVEQQLGPSVDLKLTRAVANNLFKLMAYKDEYEVARLYRTPDFAAALEQQFEGDFKLRFHLAPPLMARPGPAGTQRKLPFGPWMMHAFALLAQLKFLRGTALDPFSRTEERKMERRLIREYRVLIEHLLESLSPATLGAALRLAALPEKIRGYGHVKTESLKAFESERERLLQQFDAIRMPLSERSKGAA